MLQRFVFFCTVKSSVCGLFLLLSKYRVVGLGYHFIEYLIPFLYGDIGGAGGGGSGGDLTPFLVPSVKYTSTPCKPVVKPTYALPIRYTEDSSPDATNESEMC